MIWKYCLNISESSLFWYFSMFWSCLSYLSGTACLIRKEPLRDYSSKKPVLNFLCSSIACFWLMTLSFFAMMADRSD